MTTETTANLQQVAPSLFRGNENLNAIADQALVIPEAAPFTQPQPPIGGMTIQGTEGNDSLTGTNGNDLIYGFGGRDTIIGGDGNDTIVGGWDGDTITGGLGSDKFVYYDINERIDRITDFNVMEDKLMLPDVFANINYLGNNPVAEGYLQFVQDGIDTRVQIDSDGLGGNMPFRTMVLLEGVTAANLVIGSNVII